MSCRSRGPYLVNVTVVGEQWHRGYDFVSLTVGKTVILAERFRRGVNRVARSGRH